MKQLFFIPFILLTFFSIGQQRTITINEVSLASTPQWIEIYNYGDKSVDIENLFISDDNNEKLKWRVQNWQKIEPNEFKVIYLDSSTQSPYIINHSITEGYLYLYTKIRGIPAYIDQVTIKNPNRNYCKFPDGLGNLRVTSKPTEAQPNKIREFLRLYITPNTAFGLSNAKFRQTNFEYTTRPGIFATGGLDIDFYLWERYRMLFGVNYTKFKYNYQSESRLDKQNYYIINNLDGYQRNVWLDFKMPILYNSFRIIDQFYIDAGFLMSINLRDRIYYDQELTYYVYQTESFLTYNNSYDSDKVEDDDAGGDIYFPLNVRAVYQYHNWNFFAQYYLRKDPSYDQNSNELSNLKYAISVGLDYNFTLWRFRGF